MEWSGVLKRRLFHESLLFYLLNHQSPCFSTLGVKAYLPQIDVAQFQSLICEINFYNFLNNCSLLAY